MNSYDIVIIGHVCRDILNFKGQSSTRTGGAAYFSSFAAKRSNARLLVITKMAEAEYPLLNEMKAAGIEILALPSPATTVCESIFTSNDLDKRTVKLVARASPFKLEDIYGKKAKIYSLAGLFRGEIPVVLIESLSQRGQVGMDLQGVLRCSENGLLSYQDWKQKGKYLPYITYLKADSLEAEVSTGATDRIEAAKILHDLGAKEVMITHSSEVILYNGERLFSAPFTTKNLRGRSGRGDTCFAAYMAWRLSHGVEESLNYAAALTSIKMESPGPFSGTHADVIKRTQMI